MQELKSRSDIVDIVSSYVNLKRRGKNMVGLCPFHNEKSPSFNVYTENGSFYCFGCGAGGDVITFIRKIENLDYIEAVKLLAQRAGLQVPEQGVDDSMSRLRQRVLEINAKSPVFEVLKKAKADGDDEKLRLYTNLLYDQALLVEGIQLDDPVAFAQNIVKLMA